MKDTTMSTLSEIWLPVEGLEDLYEVSNMGRVRSLDRVVTSTSKNGVLFKRVYKGRVIKQQKDSRGLYWTVSVSRKCCLKTLLTHILVAKAFVPNPNNLPEVNHKDCDPANNIWTNLEWCDRKYNVNYADARIKQKKKVSKPVLLLTKHGILLREFSSRVEAAKQTGVSTHTISKICLGQTKNSKLPFIFKYKLNQLYLYEN